MITKSNNSFIEWYASEKANVHKSLTFVHTWPRIIVAYTI